MMHKLKAIYRDGTFIPQVNCALPNDTEVELAIYQSRELHPDIIDPEARKEVLNSLLKRMKKTK